MTIRQRVLQMEVFDIIDHQRALADGTDKHGYIVRAKTEGGDTIKLCFDSEGDAIDAGFLWKTRVQVTIDPPTTLDDFEDDPPEEPKKKKAAKKKTVDKRGGSK